ncbi:hypothetical protein [Metallosphaera hakonensis]|nr:hypothetical protein [Metallosphaera hakonensis]
MIFKSSNVFSVFRNNIENEKEVDERTVTNSYLFTEALLARLIESESEIDLDLIIEDLRNRLGNNHPVLVFLKQLIDE